MKKAKSRNVSSLKGSDRTDNLIYFVMAIPALLSLLIWKIIPMFGIVIAFKDYSYVKGIFGSDWVGFKNFEVYFKNKDFGMLMRNTLGYNITFLLLTATTFAVIMAILLYQVKNKVATKVYHTAMILPSFISYVIIAYIVYTLLNPSYGFLNTILSSISGKEVKIQWYEEARYWPFILYITELWRDIGMASLYFYASLLAIDSSLYEAAKLDGANKLQETWYISLPEMMPMVCTILILRCGSLLGGDMGLFYQVPMNQQKLRGATEVFSTYVYRGIQSGNFSTTAAIGLFNSVVGMILILLSNSIIRRVDKDKAIF